jgi:hypothetical protein
VAASANMSEIRRFEIAAGRVAESRKNGRFLGPPIFLERVGL